MRETDEEILKGILQTAELQEAKEAVNSMFELLASDKDLVECKKN